MRKLIQTQKTSLYSPVGSTTTTFILSSLKKLDGTNYTPADIGDLMRFTIDPAVNGKEEICTAAGSDFSWGIDGLVTITNVNRGRKDYEPYDGGGYATEHDRGAEIVFGNNPQVFNDYLNKYNDENVIGKTTFPSNTNRPLLDADIDSTDDKQLITRGELNRTTTAGAPNASTTAKGIVELPTTAELDSDNDTGGTGAKLVPTPANLGASKYAEKILVRAQSTPSMVVSVPAFRHIALDKVITFAGSSTSAITAPATNPRIDLVVINSAGSLAVRTGTEVASPVIPTPTSEDIVLGSIYLPTTATGIFQTATAAGGTQAYIQQISPVIYAPTVLTPQKEYTEIVAGENLTTQKPAWINPIDSKAYTAHGFKLTAGSTIATPPLGSDYSKFTKLNATQALATVWSSSGTLQVYVINMATGATVTNSTVSMTATFNAGAHALRITDSTFIVFYSDSSGSRAFRFRTGSISGGTITMDTDTAYPGSPTLIDHIDGIETETDGKIVLAYSLGYTTGGTTTSTLSYLTVATNSVTVTYTTSYTTTSGSYWAQSKWVRAAYSAGMAYGLYSVSNSGGYNVVAHNVINTRTGLAKAYVVNTPNESFPVTGLSSMSSAIAPSFGAHDGKAYYGYTTNIGYSSGLRTYTDSVIECSYAGSKLLYTNSAQGQNTGGGSNAAALPILASEAGVWVQGTLDYFNVYGGLNSLYIQRGKIYGFYNLSLFSSVSSQKSYAIDKDTVFAAPGWGGNTLQYKLATPFDGFVKDTTTSGNNVLLEKGSITLSGLTANTEYFLKDAYTTAGDIDSVGTIDIGRSLSTTKLLTD